MPSESRMVETKRYFDQSSEQFAEKAEGPKTGLITTIAEISKERIRRRSPRIPRRDTHPRTEQGRGPSRVGNRQLQHGPMSITTPDANDQAEPAGAVDKHQARPFPRKTYCFRWLLGLGSTYAALSRVR